MRECRYFVDCDAFYELIVWAEPARLMNTIRDRVDGAQGIMTPFPPLMELQRRFMVAKDRYEVTKQESPTDQSAHIECDEIALNAFTMAINTIGELALS